MWFPHHQYVDNVGMKLKGEAELVVTADLGIGLLPILRWNIGVKTTVVKKSIDIDLALAEESIIATLIDDHLYGFVIRR